MSKNEERKREIKNTKDKIEILKRQKKKWQEEDNQLQVNKVCFKLFSLYTYLASIEFKYKYHRD